MGPGEAIGLLIAVGFPSLILLYLSNRFFRLREKRMEIEAGIAAEKAAQYASRTHELEQRLRVIEEIVTDQGIQTAGQIEALRSKRISKSEIAE